MRYTIPSQNLPKLEGQLAKLNEKAVKLGCPNVSISVVDTIETKNELGLISRSYVVEVTGEAPKIKGWSFVSIITHTPNGNLIRNLPNTPDVSARYVNSKPICDHCKLPRARKNTYILQNEAGELKQVGSDCLSDFLGHASPEQIASHAEHVVELVGDISEWDDMERQHSSVPVFDFVGLQEYLATAVSVINKRGYVSSKAVFEGTAQGPKTADVVLGVMSERHPDDETKKLLPEPADFDTANKIIEYVRNEVTDDGTNSYLHNLKILTKGNSFPVEGIGFVASLVTFYNRETGRKSERQARFEQNQQIQATSGYLGKVGDKITADVKVIGATPIESRFGCVTVYRMLDEKGNLLIWFASNPILEIGDSTKISGTIKELKEYRDTKETVITRCKRVEGWR